MRVYCGNRTITVVYSTGGNCYTFDYVNELPDSYGKSTNVQPRYKTDDQKEQEQGTALAPKNARNRN